MKKLRSSPGFVLPAFLTLICLTGAMHLNVIGLGVKAAPAYVMPDCPNSGCYGPEMCWHGRNQSCVLSGAKGPCTTSWCP